MFTHLTPTTCLIPLLALVALGRWDSHSSGKDKDNPVKLGINASFGGKRLLP